MDSLNQESLQFFSASTTMKERQNNNNNNFNISSILGHLATAPQQPTTILSDEENQVIQTIMNDNNNSNNSSNNNDQRHDATVAARNSEATFSNIAPTVNSEQINTGEVKISKSSRPSMQRKQSVFLLDGSPIDPRNNNKLLDISLTKQANNINYNHQQRQQLDNNNRALALPPESSSDKPNATMVVDSDLHQLHQDIFSSNSRFVINTTNTTTQQQHNDYYQLHRHISSSSSNDASSDSSNTMFIANSSSNRYTSNSKPQCQSDAPPDSHHHKHYHRTAADEDNSDNSTTTINASNRKDHHFQHFDHQANNNNQLKQHHHQQQQPMNLQHFKNDRHDSNLGSTGSSRASSCDEQQAPTSSLSSSTSSELASNDPTQDDPDSDQSTKTFTGIVGEPSLPTPQLDTIQKHLRRKSMPNPDLIGQHISNIISQNQAIVDNFNPWTRKNYTPRDSRNLNTNASSESSTNNNTMRKRWSTSNSPRCIFGNSLSPGKTHKYHHSSNGLDSHNQVRKLSTGKSAMPRNKSSVTNQEQLISKVSSHNLVESKLESALRGTAHKNLDSQIFEKSEYLSLLAGINNQPANMNHQTSGYRFGPIHLQEQNFRSNRTAESELLSNLSSATNKAERIYDSLDCLVPQNLSSHRDTNDLCDRRYSLNCGYEMNGLNNGLLDQVVQNAALLKQLELQQFLIHRHDLARAYISPTTTTSTLDQAVLNQNSGMLIQSKDAVISNASLDGIENMIKDNTSLYPSVQPQNQSSINQRLKAQQERDQALIRDFLINVQNNNGYPQQQPNTNTELSHLIDTNPRTLKNFSATLSNMSSFISKPTSGSMNCSDAYCKDYSFKKNQTHITPNDRNSLDTNLNQIHVCNFCKTVFRNWDTLIAHQTHYCRSSVPLESVYATNTPKDLFSSTHRNSIKDDLLYSQKSRRNSSTLGELADKVKNVFVTNKVDLPIDLHLAETLRRRDSKSISPRPLSSNVDGHDISHFDARKPSVSMMPTSPGKHQTNILKQQLLGPSITPMQSLPPKKRKISEPNLKFAGFNVGSSVPGNTVNVKKASPDQSNLSLLERSGVEQGLSTSTFKGSYDSFDLSIKKNIVDDSEETENDLYGSDTCSILKKQCASISNIVCESPKDPLVNNREDTSSSENSKSEPLSAETLSDYMPHVLDVSARILVGETTH